MMNRGSATRTTIVYGLFCGLFFVPLQTLMRGFIPPPAPFRLTLALYIGLFSILMMRWGKKRTSDALFPVLMLIIGAFIGIPGNAYLLICLFVLSWLRSGVAFPGGIFRSMGAELVICLGGGLMVERFAPYSGWTWALCIWLFFLIQSVYFILFTEKTGKTKGAAAEGDPFERASREAEKILSEGF